MDTSRSQPQSKFPTIPCRNIQPVFIRIVFINHLHNFLLKFFTDFRRTTRTRPILHRTLLLPQFNPRMNRRLIPQKQFCRFLHRITLGNHKQRMITLGKPSVLLLPKTLPQFVRSPIHTPKKYKLILGTTEFKNRTTFLDRYIVVSEIVVARIIWRVNVNYINRSFVSIV